MTEMRLGEMVEYQGSIVEALGRVYRVDEVRLPYVVAYDGCMVPVERLVLVDDTAGRGDRFRRLRGVRVASVRAVSGVSGGEKS